MNRKHISILVVVFIVCFSIACRLTSLGKTAAAPTSAPIHATATRRPTRTPLPTQTPEKTKVPLATQAPEKTSVPLATLAPQGNSIFFDDFSSDAENWTVGNYPGKYADSTYTIDSGVYKWTITSHDSAVEYVWLTIDSLSDLTIMADAKQTSSNADDCDYGIIFRNPDDESMISFTVSNVDYSVYSYDKTNGWSEIIPWTSSNNIMPGASNQLKLVISNGHYTFFSNDHVLTNIDYSGISVGQPGLVSDVFSADKTCNFEFDNFGVTKP